jgi:hypothetical protein
VTAPEQVESAAGVAMAQQPGGRATWVEERGGADDLGQARARTPKGQARASSGRARAP